MRSTMATSRGSGSTASVAGLPRSSTYWSMALAAARHGAPESVRDPFRGRAWLDDARTQQRRDKLRLLVHVEERPCAERVRERLVQLAQVVKHLAGGTRR